LLQKKKKKNKNRIFFNSLSQTTLNPSLQTLFLQTWKIQNQKFPKYKHENFNGWIWEKRSLKPEKYFNNPLYKRRLKKFRKRKKLEAFDAKKKE